MALTFMINLLLLHTDFKMVIDIHKVLCVNILSIYLFFVEKCISFSESNITNMTVMKTTSGEIISQ